MFTVISSGVNVGSRVSYDHAAAKARKLAQKYALVEVYSKFGTPCTVWLRGREYEVTGNVVYGSLEVDVANLGSVEAK